MSQSKRMVGFLAILFALTIIGLSRYREQRAERGAPDSAVGDSAYQARLRNWRRDSTVLDSVTRQVNTAKLYALYRQALGKEGVTLRLMTELGCEEVRLGIQYGEVPWQRASNAVRDTVYRDIGVATVWTTSLATRLTKALSKRDKTAARCRRVRQKR